MQTHLSSIVQNLLQQTKRDASGNLHYMLTDHASTGSAQVWVLSWQSLTPLAHFDFAQCGALTSQQRYLPFGQVRTDVPSLNVPSTDFTYTGQRALDEGMGNLMDYRARFYSLLMRFIQPDNTVPNPANPQHWNRFGYVNNSPIICSVYSS